MCGRTGSRRWQPQIQYLLLEERRYAEADLRGLRNIAAALFRLENSRTPADIAGVVACLVDWLAAPTQTALSPDARTLEEVLPRQRAKG